jgi:hypothetical protein
MTRPACGIRSIAVRRSCQAFLLLTAVVVMGCAASLSPQQMYDGPPLPKEQVAIVHSGCIERSGLTIMTTQIDGKDVAHGCSDFALLPGEHHIELSAKQQSPKADAPVMSSGMVLGGRPAPTGARPNEESRVIWASTSPLRITCTVQAGQEVIIVGAKGLGEDWQARCQDLPR